MGIEDAEFVAEAKQDIGWLLDRLAETERALEFGLRMGLCQGRTMVLPPPKEGG